MAFCPNCGTNLVATTNFCPNCGTAIKEIHTHNTYNQNTNQQWSNTAKTVGTVAGAAVGVSLLNRLVHRRRRPPVMPPRTGPMGGSGMHGHGPMGGPGGRGHGPMGGPGRR